MGLRAMLNLLIGVAVFSILCIGALSFWGANAGQNATDKVFVAKDLTADILPPPLYPIEMRLVLSQAIEGTMPVDQAQSELLLRPCEVLSGISNPTVLEVAHNSLRGFLQHRHMLVGSFT